ncbi:hypothetical protein Pyrde_0077 [Pyrodictium delaneyi]|uniref:Uncharacterized protein n=1 Tax=Pyrodictium delaneyi TaxID=1273541 RepID=A0A0P0N1T5_9CREN|nr:hypothetical protein [Pyrodictium delaneyi]ALL00127.1 hypothetical protein Pyrde_0077 [Pyrodictium delaneyi]OWJ54219.1 hypothetical protein Pdsh_06935 [Pyrodictium delaneyi]
MHHICLFIVEADSREEAEELALCAWTGDTAYCAPRWWPPPVRVLCGVKWDYATTVGKLKLYERQLIEGGVPPSCARRIMERLPRCPHEWDRDDVTVACLDFPARVSDLGIDAAYAIAAAFNGMGDICLNILYREDTAIIYSSGLWKLRKLLNTRSHDKLWLVIVDAHE